MKTKADKPAAAQKGAASKAAPPKPEAAPTDDALKALDGNPIAFLVAPTPLTEFDSKHWERTPLLSKATKERKSFLQGLYDINALLEEAAKREIPDDSSDEEGEGDEDKGAKGKAGGKAAKKEEAAEEEEEELGEEEEGEGLSDEEEDDTPLIFGADVNAARYTDGAKEVPEEQLASKEELERLHKEGYTFQVLQPQRFSDGIWRLVSALEIQLGCLVGCNAYLTPKGAQGLAPHYDDVELWICQTQGSKRWRLYKPLDGYELPNHCSQDLEQEEIGEPFMEVTLQVGDVLYLPRGTIHQAVAQEEGSAHLTLSTYQRWTWGDLASSMLRTALESKGQIEGMALPIELRRSMPRGFLFECGLQAELLQGGSFDNSGAKSNAAARVAEGLRALADQLEGKKSGAAKKEEAAKGKAKKEAKKEEEEEEEEKVDPGYSLVPAATDMFAADFLKSRIRPHPAHLQDKGPHPSSLEDRVLGRGKGLFMIVPVQGPADEEVPEGFVKLCTPLRNSRKYHMLPDDMDDDDHGHGHGHMHGDSDDEHDCCGKPHCHHVAHKGKEAGDEGGGEDEDSKEDSEEVPDLVMPPSDEDEDEDEEGDSDEDEEEEEGLQGPVVPASYAPIIAKILGCTEGEGIRLADLVDEAPHQDEDEVLRLVFSLWGDGFVRVKPAPATEAKKEKQAEGKKGKAAAGSKNTAGGEGKQGKRKAEDEAGKPAGKGEKAAAGGKAKKARS